MFSLLFAAVLAAFTTRRLRTYLHAFQQEEYDGIRLLKWYIEKHAWDHYLTLGLLIGMPFAYIQPKATFLIATFWLLYRNRKEPNPTEGGPTQSFIKKPLVATARATRILYVAAVLPLPAIVALAVGKLNPLMLMGLTIALAQGLPLLLIVANLLLKPFQVIQNQRYLGQARTVLMRLNPTVIGITGSFGKTSTKVILNHILNNQSPTLATPGSINTPLGIARVVREQLQPQHQYFIAEMGAYAPGSIAGLCRLAPPKIACITAIGQAHYERFKSLETVAKAKFEIADATTRNGGLCILNADAIPDALWQPRVSANPKAYRLVTSRKPILREGDYLIAANTQTTTGLTLAMEHNGETTAFTTPLFGSVQVGNLAVAFAMATELKLPSRTIATAMATAKPAPHRLNIQHHGAQTVIDDSYNANPAGFATALETLTLIAHAGQPHRRRILITPGMVELGTAHGPEHATLGRLAAANADVILAVAPARIPTFTAAVRAAGTTLHLVPTLAAARAWMQANTLPDDVILIANDLPDRYESVWNL